MFQFLHKYLSGPAEKLAQYKIVRAVMTAGLATLPFTIVGSMFLVLNSFPQQLPFLVKIFAASFFKISDLYMVIYTMTIGALAVYFTAAFAYELTSLEKEQDLDVHSLTGALLSLCVYQN